MPNNKSKAYLLPVDEARTRILEGLTPTKITETISLEDAVGKTLARDISAGYTLPSHDVSSMDGYAVRANDILDCPTVLKRVGESAAGHPWDGSLETGQAVRIFTGAIIPEGADTIIPQENADAKHEKDGTLISIQKSAILGQFIRPAGLDISTGDVALSKGTYLTARSIGLATAAGATVATVTRPPRIGIISTGDELVAPGNKPKAGQIISSNASFLNSFVNNFGGCAVDLGIASDQPNAVYDIVVANKDLSMVVTSGGASVGVHDHIVDDLNGGTLDFWKIAMRPGKPLIWGKIGSTPLLGLPGNPVSTAVCALIFLAPAISKLLGGVHRQYLFPVPVKYKMLANDEREDYIRAKLIIGEDGQTLVVPAKRQDSSMISTLVESDAFIVRPPHDPPKAAGDLVNIITMPHLF